MSKGPLLAQEAMIGRVKELSRQDEAVRAVMMYGSFTEGRGDAHSDIEFVLFFRDDAVCGLDKAAWLARIAPVAMVFDNEFGVTAAVFENMVRGEFHFERVSNMATIAQKWPGVVSFPSTESTLIADKEGELAKHLEPLIGGPPDHGTASEEVQGMLNRFINWFLLGTNVLERGEHARALDALWWVQRCLLELARACEGATEHWLTPSRLLEEELSLDAYTRFAACTSALDANGLWRAYVAAWDWATEMVETLSLRVEVSVPGVVRRRVDRRMEGRRGRS